MNQTSLIGRPLYNLYQWAEKRGIWSGPLTSSSPELARLWAAPAISTGMNVSETTALTYSAFWGCVNNISTDVASLPLNFYKRLPDGGKERLTSHKLHRILHDEPNPEMDSMQFREMLQGHVLTWGNGYAEIQRDGSGAVAALWPITPDRVTIRRDPRTYRLYYEVSREDGGIDRVAAENMFHLHGLSYDGVCGYSVVSRARESIGLGMAAERFGGTFFGNGATFGGVFEHPTRLSDGAFKNFRDSVNAQHQGVEKAHKFLIVEEGMKYQTLGIPPNDAQFLETRQHQIEEICRWFRMPPHKLQHLLRATNNNIEHQGIEYAVDTIRPWCVRWEHAIRRKLVAPSERMIQFAEHNMDGLLRGDAASRNQAYAVGRQWGWYSVDDIREKENMNPLPNGQGKIYLVPVNMAPADRLNDIIDKQVEPTPKPVVQAPAARSAEDDEKAAARVVEAIHKALEGVEARIAEAAAKVTTLETDKSTLLESNATLAGDLTNARAELTDAHSERATLQSLLLEAQRKLDALALEKDAVEQAAKDAIEAAQAETERERRFVEQAKADAVAEAARLQADIDAAVQRASDAAKQVTEAEEKESALKAERDALEQQAKRAQEMAETATAAVLTTEMALKADVEAAEARAAQVAADLEAMKVATTAAEAMISKLHAELAESAKAQADTATRYVEENNARGLAQTQLAELNAVLEETQKERDRLISERDLATRDALTEQVRADDAHKSMKDAIRKVEEATLNASASRDLLAEETAAKVAEAEAHAATKAQLAEARAQQQGFIRDMARAQRYQILETMGRMVAKEVERVKRNSGSQAKTKAWADGYFVLAEDKYVDALRPEMRGHLVLIGSTEDVDAHTRRHIRPQLLAAHEDIRRIAEGDPEEFPQALEQLISRWERERPSALADALQKEVDHV